MKNYKANANKYISLALSFIFSLSFLCSCESEETSNSYFSEILNSQIYEESIDENFSDSINSEESTSIDMPISTEEELSYILNKYLISDNFSYELKVDLFIEDTVTTLNYNYGAWDSSNSYSICRIISEDSEIWKTEDYYFNGKAYLNDVYLGKSSFQCGVDIYNKYINKNLCYYDFSSTYSMIAKEESVDGISYSYELTHHIMQETFVKLLKSSMSIKLLDFEDGKIEIFSNEEKVQASAQINANAFFDETSYPASMIVEISVDNKKNDFSSDFTEYKSFDSAESFTFSKVFYNLSSLSAYSLSNETRIYIKKESDRTYTDINTDFSSSFLTTSPNASLLMKTSNDVTFEKYITGGANYERLLTSKSKNKKFKESYVDSPLSKIDTIGIWCPVVFSLNDTSNYSVEGNDDYYIIEYTYTNDAAYNLIYSCKDFYLKYLNEDITKKVKIENYTVEKAVGTIVIRKADMIIVENDFNISINFAESQNLQIISSTEILTINEDVQIEFPDFKSK